MHYYSTFNLNINNKQLNLIYITYIKCDLYFINEEKEKDGNLKKGIKLGGGTKKLEGRIKEGAGFCSTLPFSTLRHHW